MFKDVTDLRYYSRRRATDNPVALDLLLVGAEGVGALLALIMPYPTLAEIGKRAALSYYTPSLTSPWVRRIISLLRRLG